MADRWRQLTSAASQKGHAFGSGEIGVRGADGTLYAAPALIARYLAGHSYLPRQGFIGAVRQEIPAG